MLTLITTSLTLLTALTGLFYQQIYTERINRITSYELMGQDTITAVIALVFLILILFSDFRKTKTKILWLGFLLYIFYVYAYYSLSGISGNLYLVYMTITGLSLYLFIFIIADIISTGKLPVVKENYPRKSLSAFFFICVLIVSIMEICEIFEKTVLLKEKINPFYVFYVLDLCFIFPMIVIAGIMNLRKSSWGYLFSGVALIKILTILPAVMMNDIFHLLYTGKFIDLSFDIIALVITLSALVFLILYLKNLESANKS